MFVAFLCLTIRHTKNNTPKVTIMAVCDSCVMTVSRDFCLKSGATLPPAGRDGALQKSFHEKINK